MYIDCSQGFVLGLNIKQRELGQREVCSRSRRRETTTTPRNKQTEEDGLHIRDTASHCIADMSDIVHGHSTSLITIQPCSPTLSLLCTYVCALFMMTPLFEYTSLTKGEVMGRPLATHDKHSMMCRRPNWHNATGANDTINV